MGFMGAAQFAPALVSGPFIGVWLHRARRRPKTSRTIAQLAGPAIAGCGVRLITAPLAIAFDAASFLVGALTRLRSQRTRSPPRQRTPGGPSPAKHGSHR